MKKIIFFFLSFISLMTLFFLLKDIKIINWRNFIFVILLLSAINLSIRPLCLLFLPSMKLVLMWSLTFFLNSLFLIILSLILPSLEIIHYFWFLLGMIAYALINTFLALIFV